MVTQGDPTHGVLDFPRALTAFHLERVDPPAPLQPWIENFWEVSWSLEPGTVHRQTNLSHAAFNVVVEDGAWVYGVPGPTFVRTLRGKGRAFGLKFWPGAFFPWWPRALSPYFDRRVPLRELWGEAGDVWAQAVRAQTTFEGRVSLTTAFLLERLPAPPGEGRRCSRLLMEDRSLIKVDEACRRLGHDARSLQRLFHREVGTSPKEVLRRYRLMEAAERLARGDVAGSELAASLGYADQAHFIRDFKAVTGVPPEAYRRRQHP